MYYDEDHDAADYDRDDDGCDDYDGNNDDYVEVST
jgi:hypothetical protein